MGTGRMKSVNSPNHSDQDEQAPREPPLRIPQLNIQDIENNNCHIFVNPNDENLPIHTLIDECDLLNNNSTLINNNYSTVSLTTPSKIAMYKFNKELTQQLPDKKQSTYTKNTEMKSKDSPKKSKSQLDEKMTKEKDKKKKKKEKPKALRAQAGAAGAGGAGKRGMADQDMMRRPRKMKSSKAEK